MTDVEVVFKWLVFGIVGLGVAGFTTIILWYCLPPMLSLLSGALRGGAAAAQHIGSGISNSIQSVGNQISSGNYSPSSMFPKISQSASQATSTVAGRRGYHSDGQPITLYHGCPDYAGALHIFDTGHFLIGSSQPSAMWFTDQFSYAVGKASHKGAVVEVYRKNGYELEYYNGHYIIRADGASPDYYYSTQALEPVRIWSPQGKRLKEKIEGG